MSNLIYGPNTEQVTAFIERCKVLTGDEIEKIVTIWNNSEDTNWGAPDLYATRDDAIYAILYTNLHVALSTDDDNTLGAARNAATALTVMDLITAEQFAILTEPFAEILVELGIVWKASEASK